MATKTNDTDLRILLDNIEQGNTQLPEFQRSWVWDDKKICKLIESLTSGFPMGALMFLEYGGDSVRFKYRLFTGVGKDKQTVTPNDLVLDGQQRLTTLYQVLKSKGATETRVDTNRDKIIHRYYYLDILKCIDPNADRLEAVISIPENKRLTTNIGRDVTLDLSTSEMEYENMMFPLNIVFSQVETNNWMMGLFQYYKFDQTVCTQYNQFMTSVLQSITSYKIPVIQLTKDTSREAVCQIFENVNTGGVPLTVFELVTAMFAAEEFDLRKDWEYIKNYFAGDDGYAPLGRPKKNNYLLWDVEETNFLQAVTLLVSYQNSIKNSELAVSCKKRDVLKLKLSDYKAVRDAVVKGFDDAANFLIHQGVHSEYLIPYVSQYIPLASIFAYDNTHNHVLSTQANLDKLARWYWCGVFGELYGSANETRYALDIVEVFRWIAGGDVPDTVSRASFLATRLLSLQTRNSAAYKGVLSLILKQTPLDFMTAQQMSIASYLEEETDIHHIFPAHYCEEHKLPEKKWNSVINKTCIYASTNRSIGGRAPSEYIVTMANKGLSQDVIDKALSSHLLAPKLLRTDDFDGFITDRASKLLDCIATAMGKPVASRDSEDTIREFGRAI
ncbi:MAG: DUF262 domain-containing protein [Bacteroidales bacterium]|nr:DUF262 domain-containing protein [Bacteroidales bacterium]